jgi:4'-phosphopantetheinyl transferase
MTPGNTITVYFSLIDPGMPDHRFFYYLNQLPSSLHPDILKYHQRADQVRTMTGKLLMKEAIADAGFSGDLMNSISYTSFKRPYIDDNFDFNISHSGRFVACCAGFGMRLGIDVEEIHPISADNIATVFREEELASMRERNATPETILHFWTRKEAILKANGRGLYMQPQEIYFIDETTAWTAAENWYLHELLVGPGHICICATDIPNREIVVKRMKY